MAVVGEGEALVPLRDATEGRAEVPFRDAMEGGVRRAERWSVVGADGYAQVR